MTAIRDSSRTCPIWIVLLALLGSWPCIATPTQDAFAPQELVSDDYYDVLEDITKPPPRPTNRTNSQHCDYDACREEQTPCSQLAALTGCLCQGITLEAVVPEAPTLKTLTPEGSAEGVVAVRWCAPYSLVTNYSVRVAGKERVRVGGDRRHGNVEGLHHGDKVCVFAENGAGEGPGSCMTYQAGGVDASLRAGLIGGALGLLLLGLLALLLWKYTRRRKSGARISTQARADSQGAHPDSNSVSLDVL